MVQLIQMENGMESAILMIRWEIASKNVGIRTIL